MTEPLPQRVEALEFYGTNDESYELFQATCGLLYQMDSLGETEKAETLFLWAKEQANASERWWKNQHLGDEEDIANGVYGYQ